MIGSRCLRRSGSLVRYFRSSISRGLSTSSDMLLVDLDNETGVATLTLNRPPVNSMNLELVTGLSDTLGKLENDKTCRGLILTSSNNKIFSAGLDIFCIGLLHNRMIIRYLSAPNYLPYKLFTPEDGGKYGWRSNNRVFCAGLDILEMYQPQVDRLAEFWRTFQNVWLSLMRSRLVTIAAINGHSPAGGCVIAMTCDYRIMAKNFTIGPNETLLGTVAPFWFMDTIINACGHRQANLCCQKGLLLTTDQAHSIGMVDEVVTTPESVIETAQNEMKAWLKIPDAARQLTKTQVLAPTVDKLLANREADVDHVVNGMIQTSVQEAMGVYLEQLKNKRKR